jgi:threonine dehydratase
VIAAREALRRTVEIVGVVAANAPSFAAGTPINTNSAETIAEGLAVRVPELRANTDAEFS